MRIVLLRIRLFFSSQSMHAMRNMLLEGMAARGHEVFVWTPKASIL
jgi:hypothetical protein